MKQSVKTCPMSVYTLPCIDDGNIVGKRGKVLVSSKEVCLRFGSLDAVAVGEAIDHIDGVSTSHRYWALPDGRRFDVIEVTDQPSPRGQLSVEEAELLRVWLRVT